MQKPERKSYTKPQNQLREKVVCSRKDKEAQSGKMPWEDLQFGSDCVGCMFEKCRRYRPSSMGRRVRYGKIEPKAGKKKQVVDSANAFGKVQLVVVWQWTINFGFSQGILSGVRTSRTTSG